MPKEDIPFNHSLLPTGPRPTVVVTDRSEIRLQRCKLVQLTGVTKGLEFELIQQNCLCGSADNCDLVVNDSTVSQHHFCILRDEQGYIVRDLGSTNGTFLDNSRVKEAYARPGSIIRAGEIYFRFDPVYERIKLVPSDATQFHELLGMSLRMREIFAVLEKVAPTDATILLQGDTGTGKGAVARAIHQASARSAKPYIVFDCGALAPTLVESELFGHERGAFTGAVQQRHGALDQAQGGTLFIDELSNLPLDLQPKLLRAIEDREFARLGSVRQTRLDCRIIAASQRDLWGEVTAGRFREDLYFRLAVVTIPLPSLRERLEDVPLLVDRFLRDMPNTKVRSFDELPPQSQRHLMTSLWPGNIRELRNTIERVALMQDVEPLLSRSERLIPQDAGTSFTTDTKPQTLSSTDLRVDYNAPFKDAKETLITQFEKEYLHRLLERTNHNIAKAARDAGIDRKHLYTLLAKHGLTSSDEP